MYAIAIHGGAGGLPREHLPSEQQRRYHDALAAALDGGYALLEAGGSSLDAVIAAVRLLEDDPLFNAGRGAALTREGIAELDAAVMDGSTLRAGGVAAVRHVKHPIELARRVMEKSRHVLLVGAGAEEFALEEGFELLPNAYFRTAERRTELDLLRSGQHVSELVPAPHGTVGAVARDARGNLAAATSTGGMSNKRPGRVGDSPVIGAGTYARNGACAVSATGHGEYFMRLVAAYHVCAAVEYRGLGVQEAVRETIHERLAGLGGRGGIIAVDAGGRIALDFNTEGMFRGARDSSGRREIGL
ncbi:MAG: isoaspartyl peptidase/L-asparaginase family protein [Steroidobacteraceae bacterium]